MQSDIEASPGFADPLEERFELIGLLHIQSLQKRGFQLSGERLDAWFALVVEISDRQVSAEFAKCPRTSVRDRVFISDAEDQRLVTFQGPAQRITFVGCLSR